MELSCTNIRKTLHRGRASLQMRITLPQKDLIQSFSSGEQVLEIYAQAAEALEKWATQDLLTRLDAKLSATSRAQRLHYLPSMLQFSCKGQLICNRWLSVTTVVWMEGDEKIAYRDDRVWDLQKGVLCPIETFLPRKVAARYLRWTFSVIDGSVWGILRSAGKHGKALEPLCVGKMKYLSSSS